MPWMKDIDPSKLHFVSEKTHHTIFENRGGRLRGAITDVHSAGTAEKDGWRFCAGLWKSGDGRRGERWTLVCRAWFKSKKQAKEYLMDSARGAYGVK